MTMKDVGEPDLRVRKFISIHEMVFTLYQSKDDGHVNLALVPKTVDTA